MNFQHLVLLRMQMKIIIQNLVGPTAMAGILEDEDNESIPTQVPATTPITGNISTVSKPDVSPTTSTAALLEAGIGLPATMEKN